MQFPEPGKELYLRKTPFITFVVISKWNILAYSHVFFRLLQKFFWTGLLYRNGDNSQIFFYVNAAVVECEEGPPKVVLKWFLNSFLSIEWLLNSMQKTPNGSLLIICLCNWERMAKLVALWWCWRAWILFWYNVLSPKCCPATIEWAPNHSCCCDGVVSITGREKENSGESWWRLFVLLLLLPVSDLLLVTTIWQIWVVTLG